MRPLLSQAPLSRSVVSRLVAQLDEHLKEWRTRKLGLVTYVYLYLDAKIFKVRVGDKVRRIPVLVALGVRLDGQKDVLAIESFAKESEPAWSEFLKTVRAPQDHRGDGGRDLAIEVLQEIEALYCADAIASGSSRRTPGRA